MMTHGLLLMVQALVALLLMWTCFCRLVKTDHNTEREVRWAILFEGLAGGLVFLGPWLPVLMPHEMQWMPGTTPAGIWLVLLAAVTLVQLATAKYWKDGKAPAQFQRGRWLEVMAVLLAVAFAPSPISAAHATEAAPTAHFLVLKNAANGQVLRLMDTICSHAGTLAYVRPESRYEFRDARIVDKSNVIVFYGCWIKLDEDAYVLLEDGAYMAFPLSSFRDPTV